MTKQHSFTGTVLILLAVIGLLMPAVDCLAGFYRPDAAVSVLSEYGAVNDSSPPHTQVWKVVPESIPDGGTAVRFFPEALSGADAVCTIKFSPVNADEEIKWLGTGNSAEKTSTTGLLLAPGFPAPCDVLPVGQNHEDRLYQEKSQAGGSVFIRNYRVFEQPVSLTEARANNWIREALPDISGLIMVTVTDDRGRPAVRQLWPVDGDWWLYEETSLRRSWRIN